MNILGQNNVRINFKKADSSSKEFAFMKAHELNNIEHLTKVKCEWCDKGDQLDKTPNGETYVTTCPHCKGYGHYYTKNIWRTGKNTCKQLIIETDNPSKDNLSLIVNHLQKLFGYKFNTIKTLHGFHIIGEKEYPTKFNSAIEQNIRNMIYPDTINLPKNKPTPSDEWYFENLKVLNNKLTYESSWRQELYSLLKLEMELRRYSQDSNYKKLFTATVKNANLINSIGDFDIFFTVLSIKYGKSTLRISKKQDNDKYEEVKI